MTHSSSRLCCVVRVGVSGPSKDRTAASGDFRLDGGDRSQESKSKASNATDAGVIHVDDLFEADPARNAGRNPLAMQAARWGQSWCHCWHSKHNVEELCKFAERLGLKRRYLQQGHFPHFDLIPSKRRLAIRLGAVPIKLRDWFRQQGTLK